MVGVGAERESRSTGRVGDVDATLASSAPDAEYAVASVIAAISSCVFSGLPLFEKGEVGAFRRGGPSPDGCVGDAPMNAAR